MQSEPEALSTSGKLVTKWPLPSITTLGSAVRAKGIERELRRALPWPIKKFLTVDAGSAVLRMPAANSEDFQAASATIAQTLLTITDLPVLPSEAEDILSISSRERHKWMNDGRLKSAGTRTVKLRGRSRAVTFHVFQPDHIEHILDAGLTEVWREEDVEALAENRRRAAGKAARTRAGKRQAKLTMDARTLDEGAEPELTGWEEFAKKGFLR